MTKIAARAITAQAFAPFGTLLDGPGATACPYSGRPEALPIFELVAAPGPSGADAHVVKVMERHPHSTQAFFSLDATDYLVVVAPDAEDGGPALDRVNAFVVPGGSAIQYRVAVWHTPMTSLRPPGRFVLHVHKDGSSADCEFVDVSPICVRLEEKQPR
ncbi:ureidoglycolate lyase [Arboricoccus pini]|uniref:Ureidoglycolate lyase n=1 Tax=Arboricoccus pini TaxID=1963835 RepID=A0A212RKV3_9PROT|nr:ureidoglycolate lyase [Arboricoccus pini]SNB73089.1 ureidoglycolate lyase [Arboricoccus pini]